MEICIFHTFFPSSRRPLAAYVYVPLPITAGKFGRLRVRHNLVLSLSFSPSKSLLVKISSLSVPPSPLPRCINPLNCPSRGERGGRRKVKILLLVCLPLLSFPSHPGEKTCFGFYLSLSKYFPAFFELQLSLFFFSEEKDF